MFEHLLILEVSLSCVIILVDCQVAGQIIVLLHHLILLQVRHTPLQYCSSGPKRSTPGMKEKNNSVMFCSEFSCSVCSTVQNQRAKLSSLEQNPCFSSHVCMSVQGRVCTNICVCTPLAKPISSIHRDPWDLCWRYVDANKAVGQLVQHGQTHPGWSIPAAPGCTWWSRVQVPPPRTLPSLRGGRTCGSCVSLSAAGWLMGGRGRGSQDISPTEV